MNLGAQLPLLWNHPSASPTIRKRILRAVLEEIAVTTQENELRLALHWKGGDHTTLTVPKNRPGQHRWKTSVATEDLLRDLARSASDAAIASILNRLGVRTAKNLNWTEQRVRAFRNDHAIAVYRDGERVERGEINLEEAATVLGVSKMTVTRLIKSGVLAAKQSCAGAPYTIAKTDINSPAIRLAAVSRRPISQDPRQLTLEYQ